MYRYNGLYDYQELIDNILTWSNFVNKRQEIFDTEFVDNMDRIGGNYLTSGQQDAIVNIYEKFNIADFIKKQKNYKFKFRKNVN